MTYDAAFLDAMIIDGTGGPARPGHVAIADGRVASITEPDAAGGLRPVDAHRLVDVGGAVLCPGFIDIHTHSDLTLIVDGLGESKLRQGVTTEVVGNCSFSAFPIEPSRLDLHADHLARATAAVRPWWTDHDGYAEALEDAGIALNVAALAGHGTLRVAAMGVDARPPEPAELGRMIDDLSLALTQGAFGMSTGLTHVPSAYGDFDEVLALAEVLAEHSALYATHARAFGDERDAVSEAIEIGRSSGVTVEFSHLAINRPDRWGRADELLGMFEVARHEGVDITFDVYPYDASSSSLTQYLPDWVQEGGSEEMRRRLQKPDVRRRALADMHAGWFNGIPWLWDRFVVSSTPDAAFVGETLGQVSDGLGVEPHELTLRLCEHYGNAIALDQGRSKPHPRSFGTFPRVLGRYVRDHGLIELPEAVRKMTTEPARRLGISDRGTIAVGMAADLVVFDPGTVADEATFERPATAPSGISHVMVNGTLVVADGVVTGDRPGRMLRRQP